MPGSLLPPDDVLRCVSSATAVFIHSHSLPPVRSPTSPFASPRAHRWDAVQPASRMVPCAGAADVPLRPGVAVPAAYRSHPWSALRGHHGARIEAGPEEERDFRMPRTGQGGPQSVVVVVSASSGMDAPFEQTRKGRGTQARETNAKQRRRRRGRGREALRKEH